MIPKHPHRDTVIEMFEGKPFPLWQRWSSWSTSSGEVMLRYRDCGHVERCSVLEAIRQPRHDIERLSRIDWYATRSPGYENMDLWRVRIGCETAELVDPKEASHEFFSFLFGEAGGFEKTPAEVADAEREASDIHSVDTQDYR